MAGCVDVCSLFAPNAVVFWRPLLLIAFAFMLPRSLSGPWYVLNLSSGLYTLVRPLCALG